MFYFVFFGFIFFLLIPHNAYAWGAGVHMGVSLTIIDHLDANTASIILSNINEYLYGSLAPDFIIGKKYSSESKHSHNWDIGFNLLHSAKSDRETVFAYGYLTHLASDASAHGMMMPKMTNNDRSKGAKHIYIEMLADAFCDKSYKVLAKKILTKYNKELDNQFKERVDSVLFSFSFSKVLFKEMTKLSFNKNISSIIMKEYLTNYFDVQIRAVQNYIELSKEFSIDILKKRENSKVTNLNAISI